MRRLDPVLVRRRTAVALAAASAVAEARRVELVDGLPAVARVAILTEAAGALASLARQHAHTSHVDPQTVASLVTDPADAFAVLGRGRWLPTMQRRVLTAPRPGRRRLARRALPDGSGQLSLFANTAAGGDV